MHSSPEERLQRLRLLAGVMVAVSLAILALIAWLYSRLSTADGGAVAAQVQPALLGIGALAFGALLASLYALRNYYGLRDRAVYDYLTKSANRQYFQELLGRELGRANAGAGPLSLAMLDLDFFKHYNDANGHQAGDSLLQEFAALLKNSLRSGDVLGRYGGEEFAVLMPGTGGVEALAAAKRLCAVVRAHPFDKMEALPNKRVTVSAGVASLEGGMAAEELVKRADEALYQAKRSGRDCAVLWDVKEKLAVAMSPGHHLPYEKRRAGDSF